MLRKVYDITGIVQGVGFRPALYRLARKYALGGWVKNCSGKIELVLEGEEDIINLFIKNLPKEIPALAKINSLQLVKLEECLSKSDFKILESETSGESKIIIPPDIAMCRECETEILDPGNKRYMYPFTTCVNCGPRYTVINSMPYDRCRTTLAEFPLCKDCFAEYTNSNNRRFHAESTACPVCGPKLWAADANGVKIEINKNPIIFIINKLKAGTICAIRGIGGYLLAADASNLKTVSELRKRKNRPHKPFAVMAKNIDTIRKYCYLSEEELDILISPQSPIVILDLKEKNERFRLLAPDTDSLGVMLPYTPLHKLLFEFSDFEMLVMTSGNKGGEPICIKNEEAFDRLNGIADFYLCHNREINLRNDDSLVIQQGNEIQVWRRARGYAPEAVKIKDNLPKNILGMGAELKNTAAFGINDEIILSPHVGDLDTSEAIDGLNYTLENFLNFINKTPEIVVVDKHPDMHSTRIGKKLAEKLNIPVKEIQHHYAHALSCMAENNLTEAIGIVFDGTGLGNDNTIWGGEVLLANRYSFKRLASLMSVPLPGGDLAVINPIRQLIARLLSAGTHIDEDFLKDFNISKELYKTLQIQIKNKINTHFTSSGGRLFDSFAVMLGILQDKNTYDGQPAVRLENYAKAALKSYYHPSLLDFSVKIEKDDMIRIDFSDMFLWGYKEKIWKYTEEKKQELALDFHYTLSEAIIRMTRFTSKHTNLKEIVLSGGVFMNRILTLLVRTSLENNEYNVFTHKKIPPNDGGISLGQCYCKF